MAENNDVIQDLKAEVQVKRAIIGSKRVLQMLKNGALQQVYVAKNCPENTKKEIFKYAGLQQIPVVELDFSNEELGILCKKNYFVAVAGTVGA